MAFSQNLRNMISRVSSSSILQSQLTSIRLQTTLTSPKLFVSVFITDHLETIMYGMLCTANYVVVDAVMFSIMAVLVYRVKICVFAERNNTLLGLSRMTTDEKLQETFAAFGQLVEAKVIVDHSTGRSKGFAFVTYSSIEEAEKARNGMNAKFLDGWVIFVDPAKPKEPRPPRQHESQAQHPGFAVNKTVGWCGQ